MAFLFKLGTIQCDCRHYVNRHNTMYMKFKESESSYVLKRVGSDRLRLIDALNVSKYVPV